MAKMWVRGGRYPEGTAFLVEVNMPRLKKTKDGVPEPPPNFSPEDKAKTFDSDSPPVFTFIQGVSEALEKKEK